MKKIFYAFVLMSGLMSAPALFATPVSSCAPDFSSCSIFPDNMTLTLPGLAISGDIVVMFESRVVDVFRLNNDFVDTGGGTGLGGTAFLFAASLNNLPSPANYTVNAVFIPMGLSVVGGFFQTLYVGNGTPYTINTAVSSIPEPGTLALLGLGAGLMLWRRKRSLHQS